MTITTFLGYFICFLVGSIPSGYLLARLKGVDIRMQGSGNIGATNISRALGKTSGLIILLADILKGLIAATILSYMFGLSPAWGAAAAVYGHCFSVFLSFNGGKGVATAVGSLLGLNGFLLFSALTTFAILFKRTRIVSLSSLLATFVALLSSLALVYLGRLSWQDFSGLLTIYVVVAVRHSENIRRLAQGTEPRFSGTGRCGA